MSPTHSLFRIVIPMFFLFLCIFFIPTNVNAEASSSWQTVGNPFCSASHSSMAFDSTEQLYVLCANSVSPVEVFKLENNTWTSVGDFTYNHREGNLVKIVIDPKTDYPFIVITDQPGQSRVMKYTGSSWVTIHTINGYQVDLTFQHSNGDLYAAFKDGADSQQRIAVEKFDGVSWTTVATGLGDGNSFPRIASNPATDQLYLSYVITSGSSIKILRWNGTSFVSAGTQNSSQAYINGIVNMAFSGNDLYIDYPDRLLQNKITVKKYDGSSWTTIGLAGFSSSSVDGPNIAIDDSGKPCVAYRDNGNGQKITVQHYVDSGWHIVDRAGFSDGAYISNNNIHIALNPKTEDPYVLYQDLNPSNTVVKMVSASSEGTPPQASITGITVKEAPNKTLYNVGEKLDLSGLVITLAWSASTTKDVHYEDFVVNDVTTSKAQGYTFSEFSESVEVSANGHTAVLPLCVWNPTHGCLWGSETNENLVVVTHGHNDGVSSEWAQDIGKGIYDKVNNAQTVVQMFDWREYSQSTFPLDSYTWAGKQADVLYGEIIGMTPQPKRLHLIGHSAGANLIQTVVNKLDTYYANHPELSRPYVHLTFLDAYAPLNSAIKGYGDLHKFNGYAEQYVNISLSPFEIDTNFQLPRAVNFDVTEWNTVNAKGHEWPRDFYINSINTTFFKVGFPFSEETVEDNTPAPKSLEGYMCKIRDVWEFEGSGYYLCTKGFDHVLVSPLSNLNDTYTITTDSDYSTKLAVDSSGVLPDVTIHVGDTASIHIEAGTVVTSGSSGWDGFITSPATVLHKDFWGLGSVTAVEIGFQGGTLLFDKAVLIRVTGQAGKDAGYTVDGGTFIKIPKCLGNQRYGENLTENSACSMDAGNDLLIWTMHFTNFITYTEDTTPPTTDIAISGTGGTECYTSDVVVTLTATDTPDGSGVASTTYSLDNGTTWLEYSAPFTISGEGFHVVQYKSTDKAGNIEEIKSATFEIVSARGLIEEVNSWATEEGSMELQQMLQNALSEKYWTDRNTLNKAGGQSVLSHLKNAIKFLATNPENDVWRGRLELALEILTT